MRVRNHVNPFTVRQRFNRQPYGELFSGFSGCLDVEVGFGRGLFLRHYAQRHPERSILGVEVRGQMVSILEDRLEHDYPNVCLVHGAGDVCFEDMLFDETVSRVFVFHPDPWFKKKHHKRRVINSDFLCVLKKKLKSSGKLYVSTDVDVLWAAMTHDIQVAGFISCDDVFWDVDYHSHWDEFSKKDKRTRFCQTFLVDM